MFIKKEVFEKIKEKETPFYIYDLNLLQRTVQNLKEVLPTNYKVHYALKANVDRQVLGLLSEAGFGADCVSGGEIKRAIETGFEKSNIVFAGVGKTDNEIKYALESGIACFNVESEEELVVINAIAEKNNIVAEVAIRVNPGIDAHTHAHITTGLVDNKFGIPEPHIESFIKSTKALKNIRLVGIHFHIGSQILDLEVFTGLAEKASSIYKKVTELGVTIKHVNLGGGLGVDYENPDQNSIACFAEYFDKIKSVLEIPRAVEIHFELGRSLVAQSGSLLTKVLYIKKSVNKEFVIVDAGMTELIRPALYGSVHKIENISSSLAENTIYTVVGPICESSDTFAHDIKLSITKRGDYIVVRSAGAYGEVMSSNYNLRPKNDPLYI